MLEWRSWLIINDKNELGHYFTDGVHIVSMFAKFSLRDLYDFFDDNKLLIYFSFYPHGNKWNYLIDVDMNNNLWRKDAGATYANRSEAETNAFTKAFKILEAQINQ